MIKKIANVLLVVALAGLFTQSAMAIPDRAPDAGSASLLLALAVGGLAAARKFLR
jgi:hypothetical protein